MKATFLTIATISFLGATRVVLAENVSMETRVAAEAGSVTGRPFELKVTARNNFSDHNHGKIVSSCAGVVSNAANSIGCVQSNIDAKLQGSVASCYNPGAPIKSVRSSAGQVFASIDADEKRKPRSSDQMVVSIYARNGFGASCGGH